jgi:hypothetical protein
MESLTTGPELENSQGPSEKSRDVRVNAPDSGLCAFRSNQATVTAAKLRYLAIWPVARAFRRCHFRQRSIGDLCRGRDL